MTYEVRSKTIQKVTQINQYLWYLSLLEKEDVHDGAVLQTLVVKIPVNTHHTKSNLNGEIVYTFVYEIIIKKTYTDSYKQKYDNNNVSNKYSLTLSIIFE